MIPLADEFVPSGALFLFAGYLICGVIVVAIIAWAIHGPATERDDRLSRVDDEIRVQEAAARRRARHRPAARRFDSLELLAALIALFSVAAAYALIAGGLV